MGKGDLEVKFYHSILKIKPTLLTSLGPERAPVCSMQDYECVEKTRSTLDKIINDTGNTKS